jgi:hypothetical protein
LHIWLAAETHPAEVLQVAVNRKEFLKLRGRNGISVLSGRDGKDFKPE